MIAKPPTSPTCAKAPTSATTRTPPNSSAPRTSRSVTRRLLAWLLAGSGAALMAACSGSLLPKPQALPARFTLDAAPAPALAASAARTQRPAAAGAPTLVVAVPRAALGFDSQRMVYLRRPHELEAFAYHEWVDTPAQMLAPLLVRALQDSGAFAAVLLAPSTATGSLRLETELIRLQQDFSGQPSQVRLTLRVVLLDAATRRAIAWQEFDASAAAASDDPVAGVAAAHVATQRVLTALVAFSATHAKR